ncbi:Type I restriction-modification system, specificity subunit S [Vibrio cholerae]|nr:restriction endonuclease subunit S [Vibrio cholerae]GHZ66377.1 Type I restriction-modification system, specificity subunit S [Vibrio cholerae]HDL9475018.1 restriction endonuclease subunit S [Vibrio cholerae]
MTEQQLPEGWQMVKFGDIAKHISKRVEPSETDLEIYVGLEHLDPDSLKIKRHGVPSDVAGQKLLVKKGQIIFGKRRAYQRKVAVADWDCICSAHAMVLEANSKNVIPEFLPFFMQSDVFMHRAVAVSEGSLSPTIKWKILADQEFPIPSFDIQRDLLKVLTNIENLNIKLNECAYSNSVLLAKLREETFNAKERVRLESVTTLKGGSSFKTDYQGKNKGDLPFIKVSDMNHELNRVFIRHSENWLDSKDIDALKPNIFDAGTVVFAKVGAALLLNRRRILVRETAIDNNLMAASPGKKLIADYLYHFLRTIDFKNYVQEGALPSVNQKVIGSIEIPLPTIEEQKKLCRPLNELEAIGFQLDEKADEYKNIKNAILNAYR